jgi:hypothetical protein
MMSAIPLTNRLKLSTPLANAALRGAARLWFVVAVLGQWIFAVYVARVYGTSAARGDLMAWNKTLFRGHIPGDTIGNATLVIHLLLAVIILFGGPLQFSAKIRRAAPVFHRLNGRLYMLGVIVATVGGTYMVWARRTLGDNVQHVAQTLNAILVVTFAVLALRYAMARDFGTHRRWALRLFLVGNGVWFMRVGDQLWTFLNGGRPVGFDPNGITGPFPTVWTFGAYLLPLVILEIYLRTEKRSGPRGRLAMATALMAVTIAMSIGIYLAATKNWLPRL